MEKLDEKGFIFLNTNDRPFKCCMYFNNPWLFYWHPDNKWVTLRQVTQDEIFKLPRNLSKEHQEVYNKISEGN